MTVSEMSINSPPRDSSTTTIMTVLSPSLSSGVTFHHCVPRAQPLTSSPRHGLLHHHQQPSRFLHLPGVLPPQPAGTTVLLLPRTLLILISVCELMQSMLCLYRCKSNTRSGSKGSRKLSLRSTHSPAGPCRNPLNTVK